MRRGDGPSCRTQKYDLSSAFSGPAIGGHFTAPLTVSVMFAMDIGLCDRFRNEHRCHLVDTILGPGSPQRPLSCVAVLGVRTLRPARSDRCIPGVPRSVPQASRSPLPPRCVQSSRHPRPRSPRCSGSIAKRATARVCGRSCREGCEVGRPALSALWHATAPEAARHFPESLAARQKPARQKPKPNLDQGTA